MDGKHANHWYRMCWSCYLLSGEEFAIGKPAAALMGGLGRTINGRYAEYTSAPVGNVVKLGENEEDLKMLGLTWEQVAAIPET